MIETIGHIELDGRMIPVYRNPHMEDTNFLVMYKQKNDVDPGIRYMPYIPMMNAAVNNETDEDVEDIIEIKRHPKPENIKGNICNISDIEKIKLIEKMVINHINKHKDND